MESISVALMRSRETRLYEEFGAMIVDSLVRSGYEARLVWDGDEFALTSDILFLLGNGRGFDRFANLLAAGGRNRPRTILWQIEPLPPPDLSPESERLALRVESCERSVLGHDYFSRAVKLVLPSRLRTYLHRVWKKLSLRAFDRRVLQELPPQSEPPNFILVRRYAWLKRRTAEGWLDRIFASTMAKTEFLTRRGIAASFVPFGFHPSMGQNLELERDIDVLFIGGISEPRRARILARLGEELDEHRVRLQVVTEACFGSTRSALINRACIFLNLANYPWDISAERFLFGMACGAMIVSETLADPRPFEPGIHFAQIPEPSLAQGIISLLRDEPARRSYVQRATTLLHESLTLQSSVLSMIDAVHSSPVSIKV